MWLAVGSVKKQKKIPPEREDTFIKVSGRLGETKIVII
jgi:hypothetical protein